MGEVRVGLIGAGIISDVTAAGYKSHPAAELVSVTDIDEAKAREKAKLWGVGTYHRDYHDLLKGGEVNTVHILLPHSLHARVAIDCVRAGLNVVVQKPIAMGLQEADSMAAAAREAGVKLCVADNYSWYPPIRAAGELVVAGKIGTPVALRVRTMGGLGTARGYVEPHTPDDWREHKSTNGGYVYDDIVHYWSVARFLMGAEIESVSAMLADIEASYEGPGVVSWRHEGSDKFGSLTYGNSRRRVNIPIKTRYYASAEDFELIGTDGILWIRRLAGELRQEPSLSLYRDGSTQSWETIETDYGASFRDNIHDIVGSLAAGRDPSLTGSEGRAQIQFAWAVYKAGRENRTVSLDEVTAG